MDHAGKSQGQSRYAQSVHQAAVHRLNDLRDICGHSDLLLPQLVFR